MILGFLSFWLVAPEFIGETRLKAGEHALAAGLLRMHLLLKAIFYAVCIAAIAIYFRRWLSALPVGIIDMPEVPQRWILTVAVASALALASQYVVEPVVRRLANSSRARQNALIAGATLFTISFILQFVATFQKAPSHQSDSPSSVAKLIPDFSARLGASFCACAPKPEYPTRG
jgi:hypothetical protein